MTTIETVETAQGQNQEVIAITQYERVVDAAKLMYEHRVGSLVVVENDRDDTMVGIITERDMLGWISTASGETYLQQVHEVMARDVVSCEPGDLVNDSLERMKRYGIRHMPIVEGRRAVGMLSARDLLEQHVQST